MMNARHARLVESLGLLLLAVLVVLPTIALSVLGIMTLRRAETAYERDVREAYSRATAATVSDCVGKLRASLVDMEMEAGVFAGVDSAVESRALPGAGSADWRLALADGAGAPVAVAIFDSNMRELYPSVRREVDVVGSSAASAFLAARQVESADGPAAALPLYEEIFESPESPRAAQGALSAIARCLVAVGRKDEAIGQYELLAGMDDADAGGDLSLPLFGRFRAWELEPTEARLTALVDACYASALTAPAGQLRFYMDRISAAGVAGAAELTSLGKALVLRAADKRAADMAPIVATVGPDGGYEAWQWRSIPVADSWRLVGSTRMPGRDGSTITLVLLADADDLARRIVTPALEEMSAGKASRFNLVTRPAYGRFVDEPLREGVVNVRQFPSPFEFWTVQAGIDALELRQVARGRAALMYWAMLLSAGTLLVGVTGAFVWARRRARLAGLQTDFVANVTHELKTPLTGIRSLAETLSMGRVGDASQQKEFLDAIVDETERLGRLVNNVLDFSRLEKGTQRILPVRTNLAELARAAAASFAKGRHDDTGCELTVEAELVHADVDPDVITRAMWNLLDNACKYSSPPRKVKLSVTRRGAEAILSVSDNGIGLTRAEARRVFRKFYRVEKGLTARTQGAGLGLTLVKSYAEVHGGAVTVESRPGQGSTFSIFLPAAGEER